MHFLGLVVAFGSSFSSSRFVTLSATATVSFLRESLKVMRKV